MDVLSSANVHGSVVQDYQAFENRAIIVQQSGVDHQLKWYFEQYPHQLRTTFTSDVLAQHAASIVKHSSNHRCRL